MVDTGSRMSPKYTIGWHFRKRSPWKEALNMGLLRQMEGGLVDQLFTATLQEMHKGIF